LLDDANDLVPRRERQRPLKIRIPASANHRIGKTRAGREHFDENLSRCWLRNRRLLHHLQDFGAAELRDAQMLPRHLSSIGAWSLRVEQCSKYRRVPWLQLGERPMSGGRTRRVLTTGVP